MKSILKKILAFFAFIPLCFKVFLRWTPLAIGLAAIPVEQHIIRPLGLGPLTTRLISFASMFVLMLVSWHVGEIIVALMALACVHELWLLAGCIGKRVRETRDAEAALVATVG